MKDVTKAQVAEKAYDEAMTAGGKAYHEAIRAARKAYDEALAAANENAERPRSDSRTSPLSGVPSSDPGE